MTVYTVTCDYSATGEGHTIMAIVGSFPNKHAAVQTFEEKFGDWYTRGADIADGFDEQNACIKMLMSTEGSQAINNWIKHNTPFFEWHSQIHFNFS